MELYDMHSHILPEIDDGAESVEVSVKVIKTLYEQGVRHICLTPHYYSHKESLESFLERRQASFNLLKPHLPQDVEFCLGAEVYVTDIIMNNRSIKELCYGNSNYILLEFPYYTTFKDSSLDFLMNIVNKYSVKPILAHIERYSAIINNPKLAQELSMYGVKFQTNAVSYLDKSNFRKLKKFIKYGLVHYIGSDAHNMVRNSPKTYKETFDLVEKKTSPNVVRGITKFSQKVFDLSK